MKICAISQCVVEILLFIVLVRSLYCISCISCIVLLIVVLVSCIVFKKN